MRYQRAVATPAIVAMLLGTLTAGVRTTIAQTTPTPVATASPRSLPHYHCYETEPAALDIPPVAVTDPFGSSMVKLRRVKRLCNPANKNNEDPAALQVSEHLLGYVAKQTPRFASVRGLGITNQFGSFTVDLVRPKLLLVPSAKSMSAPPGPLLDSGIGHFKCYQIKGAKLRTSVRVQDQFAVRDLDLKRPSTLCLPADKNNEGVLNPSEALACFHVLPDPPFRGPDNPVFVHDQFGAASYAVNHPRELCVPSTVTGAPGVTCDPASTAALDHDGEFTVPDWSDPAGPRPFAVNPTVFGGSYTVVSNPAPGTVVTVPGQISIDVTVTGINNHTEHCHVTVDVLDRTPPVVTILGVNDGDRFVTGEAVVPTVEATDVDDPANALVVELYLGDTLIAPGTPITTVGLHTLRARASDPAGNVGDAEPVTFEIRARPLKHGVATVQSASCTEQGSSADLEATLLVGATLAEAAVADLDLHSVALWPLNDQGFPLTKQVVFVDGTTDSSGGYVYPGTLDAEYTMGFWRLHFKATTAGGEVIGCPTAFRVTATGKGGAADEFDFEAEAPAAPPPDPVAFMLAEGAGNGVAAPAPPAPDPCPPCKWQNRWNSGTVDRYSNLNPTPCPKGDQTSQIVMLAQDGLFQAYGSAEDNCFSNAQDSHSVIGKADWSVWLEGRPKCCKPTITVVMQPSFKASVEVNPPGKAYALGGISVATDCQNKTALAKGGAEHSDLPPTKITFGASASVGKDGPAGSANLAIETTLTQGTDSADLPFSDNTVATCEANQVRVAIVGVAAVRVFADADAFNWYAAVKARLYQATRAIKVEAACAQDSECVGVGFAAKVD